MSAELIMSVVWQAINDGDICHAAHPVDLTVVPKMIGFSEAVFNPVGFTNHAEVHRPGVGNVSLLGLRSDLGSIARQEHAPLIGLGHARRPQIAQRVAITGSQVSTLVLHEPHR